MSTGSTPPAQPPMTSPDGKWVWDGQKWIPVAQHESVFGAYNRAVAQAQAAAPIGETMVSPPVNPFATATPTGTPASPFAAPPSGFAAPPPTYAGPPATAAPAVVSPPIVPPVSYTAGGAVPPWQRWASGDSSRSRTLYLVGAFIAVMLGVILLIYFGLSELPFLRAGGDQGTNNPAPAATPIPQLTARSEVAIAGRYVSSVFTPADNTISQPYTNYAEACNGTLTLSCQSALGPMDDALKSALAKLGTPPPACIAPQVAKFKADLTVMDNSIPRALKGYADNNRAELQQAMTTFNSGLRQLAGDRVNLAKALAACDDQHEGP